MRTIIALGLVTAAGMFGAAPNDYYPLQTNNQWIYQASGNLRQDPVAVSITQSADFGGQTYFLYSGLDGPQWLRADDLGVVYAYDSTTRLERILISADGTFKPANSCNQTGHIVSTNASYSGPLGTWQGGVIEVQYDPGSCADAGTLRELYLPYVGLVQRTVQTIAGPRTYDLVYARLGGVMVATAPETSFTLALDNASYTASPTRGVARARLALRHTGPDTLKLDFTSGQEFDLTIRNSKGEAVYQWSSNKLFAQVLHSLEINGEKDWALSFPLDQLAPGSYTAEGFLTNIPARSYTSTVAFTIVAAP
jgi:hypothetical protein